MSKFTASFRVLTLIKDRPHHPLNLFSVYSRSDIRITVLQILETKSARDLVLVFIVTELTCVDQLLLGLEGQAMRPVRNLDPVFGQDLDASSVVGSSNLVAWCFEIVERHLFDQDIVKRLPNLLALELEELIVDF